MARKKKQSLPTRVIWLILTVISGSGLGGPMIAQWLEQQGIDPKVAVQDHLTGGLLQDYPGAASIVDRLTHQHPAASETHPAAANATLASSRRPAESLLIASFNIQVLGVTKLSKPNVVQALVDVIRQFDVVAIQEVRAQDDDILPRLIAAVNADGSRYHYLIGPRLGRSVSTEQYAFVYDTQRVEHDPSSVGTIQDPSDLLHREPLVARFRARTAQPNAAFTFWLVNVHTDPDEVAQEVDVLANVFQVMQAAIPDEDDVIMLGDFNASETQLGRLGQIPGITWTVHDAMTNTRQNKAYDNLIFHSQSTAEFTGRWGVFDLQRAYGISLDDALKISDHLPVWGEFQIWESAAPNRFANQSVRDSR